MHFYGVIGKNNAYVGVVRWLLDAYGTSSSPVDRELTRDGARASEPRWSFRDDIID